MSDTPEQDTTSDAKSKMADGALGAASKAAGVGGAEKLIQGSQSDGSWGGDIKEVVEHAKAGATVASVVPGVGTAVGAAAGAASALVKNKGARKKLLLMSLIPVLPFVLVMSMVALALVAASSQKVSTLSAVTETVVTAEGFTNSDIQVYMQAAQGSGVQWTVLAAVDKSANGGAAPADTPDPVGDEGAGDEPATPDPGAEAAPTTPPYGIDDLEKFNKQLTDRWMTPVTPEQMADRVLAGRAYGQLLARLIQEKDSGVAPGEIDVGAITVEGQNYRSIPQEGTGFDQSTRSGEAFTWALSNIASTTTDDADKIYETALRWTLGKPLNCADTLSSVSGEWVPPTYDADGKVGSGFGRRWHPVFHVWRMHEGSDLGNALGTPIFAAHAGKVSYIGANSGAGNFLKIDHDGGVSTQYLHMDSRADILVNVGDSVTAGQKIANMGNSGASTSPHLHFEVIKDGKKIDPEKFYASMGLKLAVLEADWAEAAGALANDGGIAGSGSTSGQPESVTASKTTGEVVTLKAEQITNASTIIGVGQSLNLDDRFITTALMTALTESGLRNLASEKVPESKKYPNDGVAPGDANSVGTMQQRPPAWGSVKNLMDVTYAARMFFGGPSKPKSNGPRGLLDISGYESYTDLGKLAQKVQVSAFPDRYDQWQPVAEAVLAQVTGKTLSTGCSTLGDITVVQANIEYVMSDAKFLEDLNLAAETNPGAITLNEVGSRDKQIREFAAENGYYAIISKVTGANAILINKGLGKVLSSGAKVEQDVAGYETGNTPRSVLHATVATSGGNLTVMVSHAIPTIEAGGKPSGSAARTLYAKRNFEMIRDIATEKAAIGEVIVGGDLNVNWYKDKKKKNHNFPYHILEGDGTQTVGLKSVFSELNTTDLASHGGDRLIDYLYSWKSSNHFLQAVSAGSIGGTISDHDFIQAGFSGPEGPDSGGGTIDTANMSETVAKIVTYAMSKVGDDYVWATSGPNTFDCSGLTLASYRAAGIKLPHYSGAQARMGTKVSAKDMQPGDLIFYYSPIHHVALYVGNGMMVHARNVRVGVVYQSVASYNAPITTVRRILHSTSNN